MRAINLLPSDARSRKSFKDEDPAVVVGSAVGAVVILALAAGFLNVHGKVGKEQSKLNAARAQLAQLSLQKREVPKTVKPVKQQAIVPVPAITAEEQPRLAAVTTAMSQRIAWDRILREFSLILPEDVSIASIQLTAPSTDTTVAPVAGATNFSISGSAYSHDGVARFLSRLDLIPDLTGVTLAGSSGKDGKVSFSISAGIKGAVVATPPPAATTPVTPETTTATGG